MLVGLFAEMPFSEHEGGIAVVSQDFGEGGAVVGEFQSVAGEAGIAVRHMPHARIVRVQACEQRGAGGRAHRVHMKVRVLQAAGCHLIYMGRGDLAAVAAEVGIAQVVAEHHDDVGCILRRGGVLGPMRLAASHCAASLAFKSRIGSKRVAGLQCGDVYSVFSHFSTITHLQPRLLKMCSLPRLFSLKPPAPKSRIQPRFLFFRDKGCCNRREVM